MAVPGCPQATTLCSPPYALLPGGYLVTKQSNAPVLAGSVPAQVQTDGSVLVTGYQANSLVPTSAPSLDSTFAVASGSVVRAAAEYDGFSANTFLEQSAVNGNQSVPRLPVDAGQLVFSAANQLSLQGTNTIQASAGTISISAPNGQPGLAGPRDDWSVGDRRRGRYCLRWHRDNRNRDGDGAGRSRRHQQFESIDILNSGTAATGTITLLTSQLNGLSAASLLIGGTRGTDGETLTVATPDLEVNDQGTALTGQDLILVSTGTLSIDSGSVISTPVSDSSITPSPLIIEGNGVSVRVSSGQNGQVTRTNVNTTNQNALLSIGSAQILAEGSTSTNLLPVGTLELDSTGNFQLSSTANLPSVLVGDTLTLNAGQISILFPNSGATTPASGLVLTQSQIQTLQQSTKNLNFLSYSSIDLYGTGSLGTDLSGNTVLDGLSLEAPQIRGYYNTSSSTANAGISLSALDTVTFENTAPFKLAPLGANPVASQLEQSLTVTAPTIQLGGGTDDTSLAVDNDSLAINGFQKVSLNAANEILVLSTAAKNQSASTSAPQAVFNDVDGELDLNTPLITSQTGANLEILAGNTSGTTPVYQNINITSTGTLNPTLEQGLDCDSRH